MTKYAAFGQANPPYGMDLIDGTSEKELVAFVHHSFGEYLAAKQFIWYAEFGLAGEKSWQMVNPGKNGYRQDKIRAIENTMQSWFSNQSFPIVGVWIDSNGMVKTPYSGGGRISHWVVLTGISNQYRFDDGKPMLYSGNEPIKKWNWRWVRVYNPFDNQTEYYPFQYFLESWVADGNMGVMLSRNHKPPPPPGKCKLY